VWVDDPARAPQDGAPDVLLRTIAAEVVRTLPIEIPANASGSLSLLVSTAAAVADRAARGALAAAAARSVPQIIRALTSCRANNTLYVKPAGSDAGRSSRRAVVVAAALGARRPRIRVGTAAISTARTPRRSASGSSRPDTR